MKTCPDCKQSTIFIALCFKFEPVVGSMKDERSRNLAIVSKIAKKEPLDVKKVSTCMLSLSGFMTNIIIIGIITLIIIIIVIKRSIKISYCIAEQEFFATDKQ